MNIKPAIEVTAIVPIQESPVKSIVSQLNNQTAIKKTIPEQG